MRLTPQQKRAAQRREAWNREMRRRTPPPTTLAEQKQVAEETMADHDPRPEHERLHAHEFFYPY